MAHKHRLKVSNLKNVWKSQLLDVLRTAPPYVCMCTSGVKITHVKSVCFLYTLCRHPLLSFQPAEIYISRMNPHFIMEPSHTYMRVLVLFRCVLCSLLCLKFKKKLFRSYCLSSQTSPSGVLCEILRSSSLSTDRREKQRKKRSDANGLFFSRSGLLTDKIRNKKYEYSKSYGADYGQKRTKHKKTKKHLLVRVPAICSNVFVWTRQQYDNKQRKRRPRKGKTENGKRKTEKTTGAGAQLYYLLFVYSGVFVNFRINSERYSSCR